MKFEEINAETAAAWKRLNGDASLYLQTDYKRDEKERLEDYPWRFAIAVEQGSSYRLGCCTSVSIIGRHPEFDLPLRWSLDFEPWSASGSGEFQFDMPNIALAMDLIAPAARPALRKAIIHLAKQMRAQLEERQTYLANARLRADALLDIAQKDYSDERQ